MFSRGSLRGLQTEESHGRFLQYSLSREKPTLLVDIRVWCQRFMSQCWRSMPWRSDDNVLELLPASEDPGAA